jgi:FlaA1/EpsC-like NDP-sugar epimerase
MPEDLWPMFTGRPRRTFYPGDRDLLVGRSVLITGAAGFLGSALAEQIAESSVRCLTLLDQSEAGLADLQVRLKADCGKRQIHTALGDVRDESFVLELLEAMRVEIVFHAAACKHVPLLEHNPFTATSVNALGTRRLIDACEQSRVREFILVSTDKVVDPVSVLGVTKRIAEQISLDAGRRGHLEVKIVRLGNVLGSTGSIAPLLLKQIARGEALTVTHPDVFRYFFSPSEGIQHLLHAPALQGSPWLWVPVMGEQRRVSELALFLQQQFAGSVPQHPLRYTGLRPGDKLRESLWSEREDATSFDAQLFGVRGAPVDAAELLTGMQRLESATRSRDLSSWLQACRMLVPEYQPTDVVLQQVRHSILEPTA